MSSGNFSPLVLHQGALGDTIQLTAMLEALASRWGGPCDLVTGRVPPSIVAGLDSVREVRRLSRRKQPYFLSGEQRALVRWFVERGPSPCYVIERWRHPIAPWSSATRFEWLLDRAGLPRGHRVTTVDCSRAPLEHAVDYFLRLAGLDPSDFPGAASSPDPPPLPRLAVSPEEVVDCREWLRELGWSGQAMILVQALSRRRKRGRWPEGKWVELVRALLAQAPGSWVLLTGSPPEEREIARLAAAIGDPCVKNVAASLPLRRLFALATLTRSAVGLDTGPMHAAAALGCPIVVLCGSADPRRNRPLGAPGAVEIVSAFGADWPADGAEWFARHDTAAITVEAVLAAWRRLPPRSRH